MLIIIFMKAKTKVLITSKEKFSCRNRLYRINKPYKEEVRYF
jgi:hypothetical protein